MTVKEMISELEKIASEGRGDNEVVVRTEEPEFGPNQYVDHDICGVEDRPEEFQVVMRT